MAVVLEIIDLVVCWKIHGCGCVADDPLALKSRAYTDKVSVVVYNDLTGNFPFMLIDGSVCFFCTITKQTQYW
jgi:hypothetical protein